MMTSASNMRNRILVLFSFESEDPEVTTIHGAFSLGNMTTPPKA